MEYKCKNCGLGVIVIPNKEPLRICNCTRTVRENGITITKPEIIVTDIDAVAVSRSKFKPK